MFMDEWMMCHGIFNASQVSDVDLYLLSDKQEKISTLVKDLYVIACTCIKTKTYELWTMNQFKILEQVKSSLTTIHAKEIDSSHSI